MRQSRELLQVEAAAAKLSGVVNRQEERPPLPKLHRKPNEQLSHRSTKHALVSLKKKSKDHSKSVEESWLKNKLISPRLKSLDLRPLFAVWEADLKGLTRTARRISRWPRLVANLRHPRRPKFKRLQCRNFAKSASSITSAERKLSKKS